jgi:hypothetical protein
MKYKHLLHKGKIYDNIKILTKEGEFLCYVGRSKADFYLTKKLADLIDDTTIQINFIPKGIGSLGDPVNSIPKENICVVCGICEELTRHHIVPYSYKKHLKEECRSHQSYDIVALCFKCHSTYEKEANKLRIELFNEFGINLDDNRYKKEIYDSDLAHIANAAKTILKYLDKLPADRLERLQLKIESFIGKIVGLEELQKLSTMNTRYTNDNYCDPYEEIISKIPLMDLVIRWRKHFLEIAQPKHMPIGWDVNRIPILD